LSAPSMLMNRPAVIRNRRLAGSARRTWTPANHSGKPSGPANNLRGRTRGRRTNRLWNRRRGITTPSRRPSLVPVPRCLVDRRPRPLHGAPRTGAPRAAVYRSRAASSPPASSMPVTFFHFDFCRPSLRQRRLVGRPQHDGISTTPRGPGCLPSRPEVAARGVQGASRRVVVYAPPTPARRRCSLVVGRTGRSSRRRLQQTDG